MASNEEEDYSDVAMELSRYLELFKSGTPLKRMFDEWARVNPGAVRFTLDTTFKGLRSLTKVPFRATSGGPITVLSREIGPAAGNPIPTIRVFVESLKARPVDACMNALVTFLQEAAELYTSKQAMYRSLLPDGDVGLMVNLVVVEKGILKARALQEDVFGTELLMNLEQIGGGAYLLGEAILALACENLMVHVISEWLEKHAQGLTQLADVAEAESRLRSWNDQASVNIVQE